MIANVWAAVITATQFYSSFYSKLHIYIHSSSSAYCQGHRQVGVYPSYHWARGGGWIVITELNLLLLYSVLCPSGSWSHIGLNTL